MSKKKHITAPHSYDPGKGRPKEYLAYLNYQEMQALKRLNGGNQERGPKGLPSFPPADAAGSSSRTTSRTSTASKTPTSKNPSGGSLSAPSRTAASSGTRSTSRDAGSRNTGGGGARDSGRTANTGTRNTSGRDTAKAAADAKSRQSAAARDAAVRQQAANKNTRDAAKNPGFKADMGRYSIGDKYQAPSGQIKGAIKSVQQTAASSRLSREGPIGPAPRQYKTAKAMEQAMLRDIYSNKLVPTGRATTITSPSQLGYVGKMVQGEAAFEGPLGQAAVAKTVFNRIDAANADPEKHGYMGGRDFGKLMAGYDATGLRSATRGKVTGSFKAAVPGTEEYRKGIVAINQALGPQSTFNKTASATVRDATHYYNPDKANPDWKNKESFERVGNHKFGNAENIGRSVRSARVAADSRINPAGFDARPKVQVADSTTAPRPRPRPPSQNMQRPTAQALLGDTDAIRRDVRISEDPTIEGKSTKRFRDRVADTVPSVQITGGWGMVATNPDRQSATTARQVRSTTTAQKDRFRDGPRAQGPLSAKKIHSRMEMETDPSYFGNIQDAPIRRPAADSYYGDIAKRPPTKPAPDSYYGDIAKAPIRRPSSESYYGDIAKAPIRRAAPDSYYGDIAKAPLRRPSNPSYYGDIPDTPVIRRPSYTNIPPPDSERLSIPTGPMRGPVGTPEQQLEAFKKTVASYPALAEGLDAYGKYAKARANPFAPNWAVDAVARKEIGEPDIVGAVSSGIAGLQSTYKQAFGDAQKVGKTRSMVDAEAEDVKNAKKTVSMAEGYKLGEGKVLKPQTLMSTVSQPDTGWGGVLSGIKAPAPASSAKPAGVKSTPEGQTKIAIGGRKVSVDDFVNEQEDLSPKAKEALRQSLVDSAKDGFLQYETEEMNGIVNGFKGSANSDEAPDDETSTENPEESQAPEEARPKNVSKEDREEMRRQERVNKRGARVAKGAPAGIGVVLTIADGLRKLFTGKSTTESDAALKRQYMQADKAERAELEAKYPNLSGFAVSVGMEPELGYSNYTSWAESAGLRGQGSREGGGPGGILSIPEQMVAPAAGAAGTLPSGSLPSATSQKGRRPEIYYQWDLGVNIPSPGDPQYNSYMIYLAEREEARRKMYDYV